MAVPFGFSAGDCIAVCILIKDAVKALDDTRGASAEYQEVIRELWSLDRALLEVEMLSRSYETSVEMNALAYTVRRTANQCKTCIEVFLAKIKIHERTLCLGGSGNRWKDVREKLKWGLLRKDDLAMFRTEINGHSSAINMLLITASVSLTRLNDRRLNERFDTDREAADSATQQQLTILEKINETLDENTRTLETQGTTVSRLAERMKYLFTLGTELKTFMLKIWTLNFQSYNILVDLQQRVPPGFKPCWIQEPAIWTDPLGRVAPLHLELINSWEVFESVMTARFMNAPGEHKIRNKEYALQDRLSQQEIERSRPFGACFLPGRRIDMSMVFKQTNSGTKCPGCAKECIQGNSSAITCGSCGIWYQRVEEPPAEESGQIFWPIAPKYSILGEALTTEHGNHRRLSTKRKFEQSFAEENISLFKRVRIINHGSNHAGGWEILRKAIAAGEFNSQQHTQLMDFGIDINDPACTEDANGFTALHVATLAGHIAVVYRLIRNGVEVNAPGLRVHRTTLELAAEYGLLDMVQILVHAGADQHLPRSQRYRKAARLAADNQHDAVANILELNFNT